MAYIVPGMSVSDSVAICSFRCEKLPYLLFDVGHMLSTISVVWGLYISPHLLLMIVVLEDELWLGLSHTHVVRYTLIMLSGKHGHETWS